jgi:hypothetical protein
MPRDDDLVTWPIIPDDHAIGGGPSFQIKLWQVVVTFGDLILGHSLLLIFRRLSVWQQTNIAS